MGDPKKVIHVDFRGGGRGSKPSGQGLGTGFLVKAAGALGLLLLVVTGVAAPGFILSPFYAPTIVVLSVIGALWFRRLLIRRIVNMQYKRSMHEREQTDKSGSGTDSRTLH